VPSVRPGLRRQVDDRADGTLRGVSGDLRVVTDAGAVVDAGAGWCLEAAGPPARNDERDAEHDREGDDGQSDVEVDHAFILSVTGEPHA
jgi:hypothetical protein